ncbi:hypothetical protein jhhlp_003305 [Lomentospora prolificans]|uniref:C2H2-type domain-containing protein n=1 Tax=Lomentospora prolificans TaxID=41688 RepID=A0A2N3NGG4_9PEZI|nr:hypothetical protein jhhlp_003305 [Lomentospora prolificans]
MMPLQSIEGPNPHTGAPLASSAPGHHSIGNGIAAAPASTNAGESGESRHLKPKTLPCKYCNKRFRRVEHVQRHERTHTKEKPFACAWDGCGKTFGRRDLLVRHEKLVHLNDGNKDANRPRKPSSSAMVQPAPVPDGEVLSMPQPGPPPPQSYLAESVAPAPVTNIPQDVRVQPRNAPCNLDLLSDAALASEVNPMQGMMTDLSHAQQPAGGPRMRHQGYDGHPSTAPYPTRQREEPAVLSAGFVSQTASMSFNEYNFFDELTSSSHFLPPPFDPEQQHGSWAGKSGATKASSQFTSRLGSMQQDPRENAADGQSRFSDDSTRTFRLRISPGDHTVLKGRIDEFSSVLPNDFVFPSRHTLIRFVEGYITGFHEHLPFLHLPTISLVEVAPELLLAILAVGAQYRFENNRGYGLWYAARAIALEQIRRRDSNEMYALLPTAAAYSPNSTRPSPSAGYRHHFSSASQDRPMTKETHREPFSPGSPQSRIETIQAVILLFAIGLWGPKAIVHESLSLQSHLAMLLREEGSMSETSQSAAPDWDSWIRIEGAIRTKLVAYCYFNLCSVTYNIPPLLLTSELDVYLPQPSRLWRAETAWQWQEAHRTVATADMTVHDAFSRLFGGSQQGLPPQISSLGNHVLIHALLQHIYLLKQTSLSLSHGPGSTRTIRPEDVENVTQALRVWQMGFEHGNKVRAAAQSGFVGGGDGFPGGPMAFNSTALLRLAYIRLCTDMVPSRGLETRDHVIIAAALAEGVTLDRGLKLHRALIQAVHALSQLVKAGVNYVARAKSSEWSVQHSLCNFECALLVSKWLVTLSSIGHNDALPTMEERNLLDTVRRMLDETEFAVPVDPSLSGGSHQASGGRSLEAVGPNESMRLRQLAAAVVRLWAETFRGSHIFEVVKVMGNSLDGYGDLVEKPRDRTPIGRGGHEVSM